MTGGPEAGLKQRRTLSARTIRIVFLVVVLVLPLELAVKKLTGAEPYPALFLPGFGQVLEQDSIVRFKEPVVVGITANGSEVPLDSTRVMPGAGSGYSVVFESIFTNQDKVESSDSREWLRRQLSVSYPEYQFRSVVFTWLQTEYDARDGVTNQNQLQTYTIDLGGLS